MKLNQIKQLMQLARGVRNAVATLENLEIPGATPASFESTEKNSAAPQETGCEDTTTNS